MKRNLKVEKQMKKHQRSKKWMSIESHLKNSVTDSELILRQVYLIINLGLTTEQAAKRNAEEGDNKLPEKKK